MLKKKRIVLLALVISSSVMSQNFDEFVWKNRLIIIESESKNTKLYQDQMAILAGDKKGLLERKLIIFSLFHNGYTKDFQSQTLPYKNQPKHIRSFSLSLIGLDGGVKLNKTEITSLDTLFDLIDSMPMRRRELKAIKNK